MDSTLVIVLKYLFVKYTIFIFMVVLCSIMGVTLAIFLVYHLTMVSSDMTTNEKFKKSDTEVFIK